MTIKNQKGIALVIAMCTILLAALTAQLFTFIIVNGLRKAREEWNTTSALYIAKTGANLAIRKLQKGEAITSTTGNLLDGIYTYKSATDKYDSTKKWITSTGTTHGENQIVRIAYGSITGESGGPGESFDYAVLTDGKQEYKGGGGDDKTVVHGGKIHSNNNKDYGCDDNEYPKINNSEHKMVESGYNAESSPTYSTVTFPELNIRWDTNSALKYYKSEVGENNEVETNNDYWHISTNGNSDNHYYHDFVETKLSPSQSSNISTSPTMPQNGGVTLIIANSTTPTIKIDNGQGTVIIIGANAEIKGNIQFTGFIFVEKNNSGNGGNITNVVGTPDIYGTIIARSLDAGAGELNIYYSSSYFQKASVKTDYDPATLNIFSWQAEY